MVLAPLLFVVLVFGAASVVDRHRRRRTDKSATVLRVAAGAVIVKGDVIEIQPGSTVLSVQQIEDAGLAIVVFPLGPAERGARLVMQACWWLRRKTMLATAALMAKMESVDPKDGPADNDALGAAQDERWYGP